MTWRTELLDKSLGTLSSTAEAQLEYLRKIELPELIDELALEFDDMAVAAGDMLQRHEIVEDQYRSVKSLQDLLKRMSSQSNAKLWTSEVLASAQEWETVRKMASECLRLLNGS